MASLFESEAGLTIVAAVVGLVWTGIKGSRFYQRRQREHFERALLMLEAGVENAWQTYVRELKRGREDGRLTREEARHARQLAIEAAVHHGQREGIDVLAAMGRDYADAFITRLIRQRKAGAAF